MANTEKRDADPTCPMCVVAVGLVTRRVDVGGRVFVVSVAIGDVGSFPASFDLHTAVMLGFCLGQQQPSSRLCPIHERAGALLKLIVDDVAGVVEKSRARDRADLSVVPVPAAVVSNAVKLAEFKRERVYERAIADILANASPDRQSQIDALAAMVYRELGSAIRDASLSGEG